MFRPTRPQMSMFETQYLLPAAKQKRLRESWARPFRERVLEAIDEEVFRDAFCEDNGRPNKSIRMLTGVHLLKEMFDLTDEQVIEQVEYNLQWQYALGLEASEAHLCQKTMHNYRVRLMAEDRARRQFETLTRRLAEADGVGLGRQRLDSTHVMSNMAVLTRLGLFVETVTKFLRELQGACPQQWTLVDGGFERRYLKREGSFADAKRVAAPRRLQAVAEDLHWLLERFAPDEVVSKLPSYLLMRRLFDEQCEVLPRQDGAGPEAPVTVGGAATEEERGEGAEDEADGMPDEEGDGPVVGESEQSPSGGGPRVQPRSPQSISSSSMQSPHDPDATYGHKGKGYELQIAETCDKDNPYQLITATALNGAHESDQRAVEPMLQQLAAAEMLPEQLLADTGYGSGANIVLAASMNVHLTAPVQNPSETRRGDASYAPIMADDAACAGATESPDPCGAPDDAEPLVVDLSGFVFDQKLTEVLRCAGDAQPVEQRLDGGSLYIRFGAASCADCPAASVCPTRQLVNGDRILRRKQETIATELRQYEQTTPEFKETYKDRSAIEATNHEMKGRHGLGRLRVRGRVRVALAGSLKALALNVKRSIHWSLSTLDGAAPCPA